MQNFDKAEQEISEALDNGEMSQKEYRAEMRELRKEARDSCDCEEDY